MDRRPSAIMVSLNMICKTDLGESRASCSMWIWYVPQTRLRNKMPYQLQERFGFRNNVRKSPPDRLVPWWGFGLLEQEARRAGGCRGPGEGGVNPGHVTNWGQREFSRRNSQLSVILVRQSPHRAPSKRLPVSKLYTHNNKKTTTSSCPPRPVLISSNR